MIIIAFLLAAVAASAAYYHFSKADGITIEGESFALRGPWVILGDVNFSGSRGIMTREESAEAEAAFDIEREGDYAILLRYFGNHGPADLELWKRAYTNTFGYIDYFGAKRPQALSISIDNRPAHTITQEGAHRYKTSRLIAALKEGRHTIAVKKAEGGGGANLDFITIRPDAPDTGLKIPSMRQASAIFGPLLIAIFPIAAFITAGRTSRRTWAYLAAGSALSIALSVMWIDTDGGFWIWLTQNSEFTFARIYSAGDALHHRYVYPPPVAVMLIALRPVFSLFGALDGITPASLLLSKLAVMPFFAATGILLHRLEGSGALVLWALNPMNIFSVAANSMYFGLAFFLTLSVYLLRDERQYGAAFALGLALSYMSAAMLVVPPFLLLLRRFTVPKALIIALTVIIPGMLVLLPYKLIDPAGLNARVMGAGISTWMSMHLGLRLGGVGVTTLLYGVFLAYLWIKRPPLDYPALAAVFAFSGLIYLNIGAPYFLAWAVAFQPFVIIWAARLRQEAFYAIYASTLMVWGSFFMNTGGAGDRAGETGFFPYYIFYSWPFDVYEVLGFFYAKVNYFSQADLEALTHSISAGLSIVMLLMIATAFHRREGVGEKD